MGSVLPAQHSKSDAPVGDLGRYRRLTDALADRGEGLGGGARAPVPLRQSHLATVPVLAGGARPPWPLTRPDSIDALEAQVGARERLDVGRGGGWSQTGLAGCCCARAA